MGEHWRQSWHAERATPKGSYAHILIVGAGAGPARLPRDEGRGIGGAGGVVQALE